MASAKHALIFDNGDTRVFNTDLFGSLVKYEVELGHTKDVYLGLVVDVSDDYLSIAYANHDTGKLNNITIFCNCFDSDQHLEVISMGGFYQSSK